MNLRTWLQSAGIAILVLFMFCRQILDTPGDIRMHAAGSVTAFALSLVVNLLLVSLLCMLLKSWLRDTSIWRWLSLILPALILASLVEMIHIARGGLLSTKFLIFPLVAILAVTVLLRWRWRRGEKFLLQLSGGVLIGLGFFCIFAIFQLLHFSMWRPAPNYTAESAKLTQTRTAQSRTVWILFDELSYQQVFGNRYPNLQLPNFDKFRKSSTLFTDVQPVAYFTEDAIPSIFLGQAVKRVSLTAGNKLLVGAASGSLHPFNAAQTPFAAARQYGLTTGVVGWYNSYCSILTPYLNQCYWTDEFRDSAVSAQKDFWKNLSRPWVLYGTIFGHPRKMISTDYRGRAYEELWVAVPGQVFDNRILVYQDLMRHAAHVLQASGPDFVFLHLPIPHPTGFYNRSTQQLDNSGTRSYIDNLALADKILGQFLAILKQSPRWENTNVVVCGDHSWRTPLWKGTVLWTPEDEIASHGGVFDPRPMLMVHLAGQTTPATMNQPFPLLKLHDILDDLVSGKQPAFQSTSK